MNYTLIPEFKALPKWEKYKSDFEGCLYGIRANSNEVALLWDLYHDKYDIQNEMGYWYSIGYIGDLVVNVSVAFRTFNGHKIFFYHGSSSISYFQAIEKFIETVYPNVRENQTFDKRYKLTDGMNFRHALDEIEIYKK